MCLYCTAGFLFFVFCVFILLFVSPLERVYYPQMFLVQKGETVRGIGEELRKRNIIASPSLFVFPVSFLAVRFYGVRITLPVQAVYSFGRGICMLVIGICRCRKSLYLKGVMLIISLIFLSGTLKVLIAMNFWN